MALAGKKIGDVGFMVAYHKADGERYQWRTEDPEGKKTVSKAFFDTPVGKEMADVDVRLLSSGVTKMEDALHDRDAWAEKKKEDESVSANAEAARDEEKIKDAEADFLAACDSAAASAKLVALDVRVGAFEPNSDKDSPEEIKKKSDEITKTSAAVEEASKAYAKFYPEKTVGEAPTEFSGLAKAIADPVEGDGPSVDVPSGEGQDDDDVDLGVGPDEGLADAMANDEDGDGSDDTDYSDVDAMSFEDNADLAMLDAETENHFVEEYCAIKEEDIEGRKAKKKDFIDNKASRAAGPDPKISKESSVSILKSNTDAFNSALKAVEENPTEANVERLEGTLDLIEDDAKYAYQGETDGIKAVKEIERSIPEYRDFFEKANSLEVPEEIKTKIESCLTRAKAVFGEAASEKPAEVEAEKKEPAAASEKTDSDATTEAREDQAIDEKKPSEAKKESPESAHIVETFDYGHAGSYKDVYTSVSKKGAHLAVGDNLAVVFDKKAFRFKVVEIIEGSDGKKYIQETRNSPLEPYEGVTERYNDVSTFFTRDKLAFDGAWKCMKNALKELDFEVEEYGNGDVLSLVSDDLARIDKDVFIKDDDVYSAMMAMFGIAEMDGFYREVYASDVSEKEDEDLTQKEVEEKRKEYDAENAFAEKTFGEIEENGESVSAYVEAIEREEATAIGSHGIMQSVCSLRGDGFDKPKLGGAPLIPAIFAKAKIQGRLIAAGLSKEEASYEAFDLAWAMYPFGLMTRQGDMLSRKEADIRDMVWRWVDRRVEALENKQEFIETYGTPEEFFAKIDEAKNGLLNEVNGESATIDKEASDSIAKLNENLTEAKSELETEPDQEKKTAIANKITSIEREIDSKKKEAEEKKTESKAKIENDFVFTPEKKTESFKNEKAFKCGIKAENFSAEIKEEKENEKNSAEKMYKDSMKSDEADNVKTEVVKNSEKVMEVRTGNDEKGVFISFRIEQQAKGEYECSQVTIEKDVESDADGKIKAVEVTFSLKNGKNPFDKNGLEAEKEKISNMEFKEYLAEKTKEITKSGGYVEAIKLGEKEEKKIKPLVEVGFDEKGNGFSHTPGKNSYEAIDEIAKAASFENAGKMMTLLAENNQEPQDDNSDKFGN
jgi:hypothetical protein